MRKKFLVKIVVIPRSRVETERIMEKHVTARHVMGAGGDDTPSRFLSISKKFYNFWFLAFQKVVFHISNYHKCKMCHLRIRIAQYPGID